MTGWQGERERVRTLRYNVRYMFLPRNVAAKPRQYHPYQEGESETLRERERKRKRDRKERAGAARDACTERKERGRQEAQGGRQI